MVAKQQNHWYQWFSEPKTIGKPLLPMVLDTKNHRKTIDINGEQRCMYDKNFVLQTVFYFQSDVKGVYSEVSL